MSYDISLYRPEFLRRAIAENLGDWTGADPIAPETLEKVVQWLLDRGYAMEVDHPTYGKQFAHPNPAWGVEVGVYRGSVGFSIAYWEESTNAIAAVMTQARELAKLTGLAIHDPQSGEGSDSL